MKKWETKGKKKLYLGWWKQSEEREKNGGDAGWKRR